MNQSNSLMFLKCTFCPARVTKTISLRAIAVRVRSADSSQSIYRKNSQNLDNLNDYSNCLKMEQFGFTAQYCTLKMSMEW